MPGTGAPARVLVPEDEWPIPDGIAQALTAAGYAVCRPIGRVRQAIDLLKETSVDAAVLDINVHEDRSFEVAERLMEVTTPFGFLSGYSDLEIPEHLGDRPRMQTPVDPEAIWRVLGVLLA